MLVLSDNKTKKNKDNWPLVALIGWTAFVLVIGIVLIIISNYTSENDTLTTVLLGIGVALVTASTIGILTEIFLSWLITKKVLNIEQSFLDTLIPKIIETTHDWVTKKGKEIPITKNNLYEIIRIGYHQWFMKENFSEIGIPSADVAKLYQENHLTEFKEPVVSNLINTITYQENLPKEKVGRDGLISIMEKTEFIAVNTSNNVHPELRYVNRNGIIANFNFGIFTDLPKDKDQFVLDFKNNLLINHKPIKNLIPHEISYLDFRKLKSMEITEINTKIKNEFDHDMDSDSACIFYHFSGESSGIGKSVSYAMYCPYAIDSGEKIHISYEQKMTFAENDFIYNRMKSLTKGLTVQINGFDELFDISLSEYFDSDQNTQRQKNLLVSHSLLLPNSGYILSWQKKK